MIKEELNYTLYGWSSGSSESLTDAQIAEAEDCFKKIELELLAANPGASILKLPSYNELDDQGRWVIYKYIGVDS